MQRHSLKKGAHKYSIMPKVPTMLTQPLKLVKKKHVTFKKTLKQFGQEISIQEEKTLHQKSQKTNLQKVKLRPFQTKKMKTYKPFDLSIDKQNKEECRRTFFSGKKQNPTLVDQNGEEIPQDKLFLLMFDNNSTNFNEPSKQMTQCSKYASLSNSPIRIIHNKSTSDDNPFQAIQREIQKRRQEKRVKSMSGLQKLSKKLLNDLNSKHKYDEQSNVLRQRYVSYFHSRIQKSPFEHSFLNRQSIEKSHEFQHRRTRTIEYQEQYNRNFERIECSQKFANLIRQCKSVQNQERIKKQISMFTLFSKDFGKKCQKRFRRIENIKRSEGQDSIKDKGKQIFKFNAEL